MNSRGRALSSTVSTAALIAALGGMALSVTGCKQEVSEFNLEFQPARIQSKLSEFFPKESCPTSLLCVAAHTPQLSLVNGSNRISLRVQLRARSPIIQSQSSEAGSAQISAKLRYERAEAALYLADVKVDNLQLRGVPDAVTKVLTDLSPTLIDASLTTKPIYTIPNDRLTERMQRLLLKDVYVHDGKLRVSIGL